MGKKNDRNDGVTKFCLAMEEHRRTEAGRVRTSKELVAHFFPWDESKATDRVFVHMPNGVRGPIVSGWGIRGAKAALKDDAVKVRDVVHDAFVAGDLDDVAFEERVTAPTLIDWVPLPDWWSFWRNGKLTGVAIQKALATARALDLIDERWFLDNVQGRGGRLTGTDVICDTLAKDQIVAWVRKIHEVGDATPAGLIDALGWETVLARTAQDALLFTLDAFARKAGLVSPPAPAEQPAPEPPAVEQPAAEQRPAEPSTARHEKLAEARPTVAAPQTDVPGEAATDEAAPDSGLSVAIPDIPAIDGAMDDGDEPLDDPPSMPSVEERSMWSGSPDEESPKLAEARAAMMAMLSTPNENPAWEVSEPPAKPSSLEWPEPPPRVSTPTDAKAPPAPAQAAPAQAAPAPSKGSGKQVKAAPLKPGPAKGQATNGTQAASGTHLVEEEAPLSSEELLSLDDLEIKSERPKAANAPATPSSATAKMPRYR